MKLNTKKLLLWLYPVEQSSKRRVSFNQIEWLLWDLTPAGRDSLVRLLEEKQLIFTDELEGELKLSLSSHGQKQLAVQIPALTKHDGGWDGRWTMLVFLQSPASDPSFRYLRNYLVKNNWFSLKRGLYLYPGPLPPTVEELLAKSYIGHAAAISFDQWKFGDERAIIGRKTNVKDLIDLYSGISSEIDSLLSNFSKTKKFTDQQKQQFFSIFDRLAHSLLSDLGLVSYYFPAAKTGTDLLQTLQQALS
ncbi:MAG: hypothetical protein GF381_01405 [Candidatus Pacebacteria bacterium]|nr:hypothetical protein [Candidatus Paceibacterota bacterium]